RGNRPSTAIAYGRGAAGQAGSLRCHLSAASPSGPTGPRQRAQREEAAPGMFTNADEVLSYIKKNDVEFIDVRFCDLPGVMQHFTFPASNFGESVFTDGLMFDGSSIRGFQQIHESDMLLLPDPTTAYMDPFRQHSTLIMNFFIHDPLTGEAYTRDPRNIARKAEDYLRRSA